MAHQSQSLITAITRFLQWWRDELSDLVPRWSRHANSSAPPRLVLSIEPGAYRLMSEGRGAPAVSPANAGPFAVLDDVIDAAARVAKARSSGRLTVRLPFEACYARVVELPVAARRDFDRILAVDLARATPFQTQSIYSAHFVDANVTPKPAPGKCAVRQLVIKKNAISEIMSRAAVRSIDVDCVDCWDVEGKAALPINFIQDEARVPRGILAGAPSVPKLAALCAGLAAIAVYMTIDARETALQGLRADIATAEAEAKALQKNMQARDSQRAGLAALITKKAGQPSKVQILEELTRLLPDSAWVADLRIDQETIDLNGYAVSAAGLITLLQTSPLFSNAELTAPVTLDTNGDKERFSLRVRIRSAGTNRTVALERRPE